jgi:hypothetical protein
MCFREHPPFESLEPSERVRILLSDPVDVELDLRFENPFLCYEAVRDGAGVRPGDPIELHVSSEGPTEFFSPFLNGAIEFCLRAEAAGVAVFTRVG